MIEEKVKNSAEKKTRKYMKAAREFIANQNNGSVPPELECSLTMLEMFYKEFLQLSDEISNLPSVLMQSRYGLVPTPLLTAQTNIASKLNDCLKECGLTFKQSVKLGVQETKDESPLDKFINSSKDKRKKKSE